MSAPPLTHQIRDIKPGRLPPAQLRDRERIRLHEPDEPDGDEIEAGVGGQIAHVAVESAAGVARHGGQAQVSGVDEGAGDVRVEEDG